MKRIQVIIFGLLLALSVFVQTTTAQFLPTDARALNSSRVPFLFAASKPSRPVPVVEQVGAIGMTVSDMDAPLDFYSRDSVIRKSVRCGSDRRRLRTSARGFWTAHARGANAPGR